MLHTSNRAYDFNLNYITQKLPQQSGSDPYFRYLLRKIVMREEDEAGFCYFDLCSLDLPPRYLSNIVITVAKNLCNTCSEKQSGPSLEQRTVTNSQACHMHSHKTQTCQSRLLTRNRAFPEIVLVKIFVIFNVLFLHSSNCNLLCQAKLMHFISRN